MRLDCQDPKLTDDEKKLKKLPSRGLWIYKPGNQNQGKGIKVIQDLKVNFLSRNLKNNFSSIRNLSVKTNSLN
jgi:hypothetical protein